MQWRPLRLFVFAIALGTIALGWRSLRAPAPAPPPPSDEQPRYFLEDAEWVRYDQAGRPLRRVRSERIEILDDESARLRELTVDQLGGDQGPWVLHAPRGYSPPHAQRLLLQDTVTIEGRWPESQPLQLATEQLWVDSETREIYTETPVVIEGTTRSVRANGLRADWDADRLRLEGDVRVRYDPAG